MYKVLSLEQEKWQKNHMRWDFSISVLSGDLWSSGQYCTEPGDEPETRQMTAGIDPS